MTSQVSRLPDPDFRNLLRQAVLGERAFVTEFLDRLARENADPAGGITRDTYGPGENRGHAAMTEAAGAAGLEVSTDAAGNSYARWRCGVENAETVMMGSHLDTVPRGGNFDGAAGVLAGLVAIRVLRQLGLTPVRDLVAAGFRAEESVWFQVSYIGSRSALGLLPQGALDEARRIDTGRSLAEHMAECGADPDRLRAGERTFDPATIAAFVEVHIEQAPALLESGTALGICTGIPGNFRFPQARVLGRHDHVGTPRRFRRDAAAAAVAFAAALDARWKALDAAGTPLAVTFGRFHTDAACHGLTTVPGLFHFALDVRGYDQAVLDALEADLHALVARLEAEFNVTFDLGQRASAPVGPVAPGIRDALAAASRHHGISHMLLGSPASHDAAAFAAAGVPTCMIFVRNENGSHNPDEAMEIDDFLDACTALADWLASEHCKAPRG